MRALTLALALLAGPAAAVQPDEMLPDPALEARAREISAGLRCLVCRNESIDESNADLARDLRLLVRERLLAGDSDAEVVAFVVERYGEYVLLKPSATGANLLLWIAGPAMLAAALLAAALYVRRRRAAPEPEAAPLSEAEKARLEELLRG
ncbi:MAG: cytochrome c-type biogenesis protein CcmH [Rhodobacteraceae bacterium]|nr:cytochrome c-type biogenesis protein CcmH [Paracoccaceae bacterium]